jgi:hypothetical protein
VTLGGSDFKSILYVAKEAHSKLEGVEYSVEGKVTLSMSPKDRRVRDLFEAQIESCVNLYRLNLGMLQSPNSDLTVQRLRKEEIGNRADRMAFLLKRVLHKAAERPEYCEQIGVDDIAQLPYYYDIGNTLERVGDIYEAIFENFEKVELKKLPDEHRLGLNAILEKGMKYLQEMRDSVSIYDRLVSTWEQKEKLKSSSKNPTLKQFVLKHDLGPVYMNIEKSYGIFGLVSNMLESYSNIYYPRG